MRIVAGCDGGGSKCVVRIAICDDRRNVIEQSQQQTGPANVSSDPQHAIENVRDATHLALKDLGLEPTITIDNMVLALAGQSAVPADWQQRLRAVVDVAHVSIVPDIAVLFAAAGVRGAAVASVVGTGSIAWSQDAQGKTSRAGGKGPASGDEGSAFWIGRQAIESIAGWPNTKSDENSEPGELVRLVHEHFPHPKSATLEVDFKTDVRKVAQLSRGVFALAGTDSVAKSIIDRASCEISQLLIKACLGFESSPEIRVPWVCAGGVAVNQTEWLADIQRRCEASRLYLVTPTLVCDPVVGALQMALAHVGPLPGN